MAAEYLHSKGQSRIAYAFCQTFRETRRARWEGIKTASGHANRDALMEDYYEVPEEDFAAGAELARIIVRSGKPYSAIAANNDAVAVGVLAGLAEMKVRVPEDISVIGFDDCVYAAMSYPALTTVRVPSEQMGDLAAHMLLGELRGEDSSLEILLEPRVIERSSVAKINP
jgi:LacI family transcriptional regulator